MNELMGGFVTRRLKEQLIKELVATGRGAQMMNKQYQEKIRSLEMVRLTTFIHNALCSCLICRFGYFVNDRHILR